MDLRPTGRRPQSRPACPSAGVIFSTAIMAGLILAGATADAAAGELFVASRLSQPVLRTNSDSLQFAPAFPFGSAKAMARDSKNLVWIASANPTGPDTLHQIDPRTGAQVSKQAAPGGVNSIVSVDNKLWIATDTQRIVQMDSRTGNILTDWRVGFAVNALAWHGGILYAAGPSSTIWSTQTSAAPSWKLEATAFGQAVHSLAIRGSQILVGVIGHVHIFERDTGFLLYGYNVPNDAVSIVVDGNDALIGGRDGSVVRADPDTGLVVEVAQIPPPPGLAAWQIAAMVVLDPNPLVVLSPSQKFSSISSPTPIALSLEVSSDLGSDHYLVLGSASGNAPGIDVNGVHIPLNVDAYFISGLVGPSIIEGSFGIFSNQNALGLDLANATLKLPTNLPASAAGTTFHHAFITLDSSGAPTAVSNVQTIILGF